MTEELLAQHLESPSGTGRDDPENQNLRPAPAPLADASYRQGPFSLGIMRSQMPASLPTARWTSVLRLPDGGWGVLKVVPADGFEPWFVSPGWGLVGLVAYGVHRLATRVCWRLRLHRRWEVRLYRFPDPDAPLRIRFDQQTTPLFRSAQPTKAAAMAEAHRLCEDLRAGRALR